MQHGPAYIIGYAVLVPTARRLSFIQLSALSDERLGPAVRMTMQVLITVVLVIRHTMLMMVKLLLHTCFASVLFLMRAHARLDLHSQIVLSVLLLRSECFSCLAHATCSLSMNQCTSRSAVRFVETID